MTNVIDVGGDGGGDGAVRVRRFRADDVPAVVDLFRRCTAATRYRRFHGVTDGSDYARGLSATPWETVLAVVDGACIGVASLAEGPEDHELGVLVEDGRQGQGVGTRLVTALVVLARTRGIGVVRAEVLADDPRPLKALARIGPVVVRRSFGVASALVWLGAPAGERPGPGGRGGRPATAAPGGPPAGGL